MMQQMLLGYGGLPPESFEYFYDGSTSTSMVIPGGVSFFKVAGVAAGSPGSNDLVVILLVFLVVVGVLEILLVMKSPLQQWRDRRFILELLQTDHLI